MEHLGESEHLGRTPKTVNTILTRLMTLIRSKCPLYTHMSLIGLVYSIYVNRRKRSMIQLLSLSSALARIHELHFFSTDHLLSDGVHN